MENATSKQMVYHILIRGDGAQDFHLANSTSTIMVGWPNNSQLSMVVHNVCNCFSLQGIKVANLTCLFMGTV